MPNWKTYDSAVRLLSAILAAHPELKLNYQAISDRYGGDCTKSAIENRFRGIKVDAKAVNNAFQNGIDPFTIVVGVSKTSHGIAGNGVSDAYGGDCTKSAILNRIGRLKSGEVQKVKQALAAGIDPCTISIVDIGKEVSTFIGGGCTSKAVSHRISGIRFDVNNIKDAVQNGVDPATVKVQFGKDIAQYTEFSASGIEHHMRQWKKEAKNLRAGGEWGAADTNGEASPIKKTKTKAPPKSPHTPKRVKKLDIETENEENDEDEDTMAIKSTPRPKAALNRTMAGRVTKPSRKNSHVKSYTEVNTDEDDQEDINDTIAKNEYENGQGTHSFIEISDGDVDRAHYDGGEDDGEYYEATQGMGVDEYDH